MSISFVSDGVGPDNEDRSEWAQEALSVFCEQTGLDQEVERDDAVSDFVANLGHYCDRYNIDFLSIISRAIGVWDAEKREEEDGKPGTMYPERQVVISMLDAEG